MADMHKLASRSGMISSGAAGFLKGVAGRQREDRDSRASREKEALAAFVALSKAGWTKGDESKGISSGEGIQLEGIGILVPPPVEGVSELDLAKTYNQWASGRQADATARKADRFKPPIKSQALENAAGQWTLHERDPETGEWIDTGKKAQAPGVEDKKIRVTSPDGKHEFYARSKEELAALLKTGHVRGWGKTDTDSGMVKALALNSLTTLRGRRTQLLTSLKTPQMIAAAWTGSTDAKEGKEPPARVSGQLELIKNVKTEIESIDRDMEVINKMLGGVVPKKDKKVVAPPWIDEQTLELYERVWGMSREKVIELINSQLKTGGQLGSSGPKLSVPINRSK